MDERSKEKRNKLVDFYIARPEGLPSLIDAMFTADYPHNFYQAWIWDGVIRKDPNTALPFLSSVFSRMGNADSEGVIRILAKTCEIASSSPINPSDESAGSLSFSDKQLLIDACFAWLQGKHKVATRVFAITALWNLRKEEDWIEEALRNEVNRQLPASSAGFRNRALKILSDSW